MRTRLVIHISNFMTIVYDDLVVGLILCASDLKRIHSFWTRSFESVDSHSMNEGGTVRDSMSAQEE